MLASCPCRIPTCFRTSLSLSLRVTHTPPPYRTDHWETALGFAAPQAAASALLRFFAFTSQSSPTETCSPALVDKPHHLHDPSGDFLARSSAMPFPVSHPLNVWLVSPRALAQGPVASVTFASLAPSQLLLLVILPLVSLSRLLSLLVSFGDGFVTFAVPCYRPIIASLHRAADAMPCHAMLLHYRSV
ncbi:uncharacterized protein BDZ83DRAFT_652825 [Colletotrichum acutatum]|uniref:Uncharacterized protein n=1 Tax=Glomerella acutata TaxID=27357 RepID=A0AAD8UMF5_GLOAC|nr:uncharacterized protein BDZ83DRAFT_652825 [Colletotrichum acutatum]KAK1723759.1 hypothetical protein BDZ83DRAFT_652825 [Colletotrichum acutatum]